ncbi:MAG TPA: hypothetical protein VF109_06170, partial [Mycobacteriales bacterium]
MGYLRDLQGADGSWTDVRLAVGTSDAWVTGFVGTALASAGAGPTARAGWGPPAGEAGAAGPAGNRAVDGAVRRAARWCLDALGSRDGWGFNATVPPDADSTAWVCTLLAASGRAVPARALDLLERSRVPGAGC